MLMDFCGMFLIFLKKMQRSFEKKWGFDEIFGFFQHRFINSAKSKNEKALINKNSRNE